MYQFSDADSTDSEDGIRFKTDSTRHKDKNKSGKQRHDSKHPRLKDRRSSKHHRSNSPYYRRDQDKKKADRNKTRNSSKSRSRSPKHRSKRRGDKHTNAKHKDHCDQDKPETNNSHRSRDEGHTSEIISFGPALPPHLINSNPTDETKSKTVSLDNPKSDINTDKLQQSDVLGPKLSPNNLLSSSTLGTNLNLTWDVAMIEPALLSSNQAEKRKSIGPVLPPDLREKLAEEAEKEDDDVYGPVPADAINNSEAHVALEERALQMKIDQLNPRGPDKINREEWMTELPQVCASNLGLTPRQFRPNPGPDLSDRSSWTDTPEDKARKLTGKVEPKVDLNRERELKEAQQRDREQDAVIKAHKKYKKKEKSLLELHQDKLKMKNEKSEEENVRRPFSREIDLQVNRFDDAQKKTILKKAQLLDSRFCQGQSKFL